MQMHQRQQWPNPMDNQSYWEKYGDSIIGRMKGERATSNSDVEISRCLSGCVAGKMLMETAIAAREDGLFRWDGAECVSHNRDHWFRVYRDGKRYCEHCGRVEK
jgi:hypothetical protein